ncbi:MAG: nucleotidyltransferase family protein [Blastocatellia bacterium]
MKSGTAGLVWRRFQTASLGDGNFLVPFQRAYISYTIHAGFYEAQARNAFALFRAHDIEPVLVKGWSIGRRYPAKGLRPYGDIDLAIRPSDYHKAVELAATAEGRRLTLDLHQGLDHLDSRSFDEFFERTQLVPLGDTMIRIPSAEDLFRIACQHMLRHGGWRPLQLCDVALLLETRSPDFRWDSCLGDSRREINWISTAIGLAHHLLGADLEGYPYASEARQIPRWLIAQVLKSWETPEPTKNAPLNYGRSMRSYLRQPKGLFGALKRRWPNPIEATYSLNGSFNNLPRFPYQLADSLRRAARLLIPHA